MSDSGTVSVGQTYMVTASVQYNNTLADPASTPTVTIYDANRNVVVSNVTMTHQSTGVYTYSYTIASNASAGVWETAITDTAASGQNLFSNTYWNVTSSPPQVIIRSMQSTQVPNIAANVRVTNEGQAPYEYQYEWCVTSNINDACGSGNNVYFASAAKLIQPGANFDTTLPATVSLSGTYYFKVAVFYGGDESKSVQQFTATQASSNSGTTNTSNQGGNSGGSGGSGGAVGPSIASGNAVIPENVSTTTTNNFWNSPACQSANQADLNCDGKVDITDFSIMLSYWHTSAPYKNPRVDIKHNGKLDLSDFSILLYYWNKSHK